MIREGRAGRFARERVRSEQLEFLRRNALSLALAFVAGVAVSAVASLASEGVVRGVILGGGVASAGWMVASIVVLGSGTAPKMSGGDAETWTSLTLRAAGPRWRHVDVVLLPERHGDVDHVLYGPGGVFALETKWSASLWSYGARPSYHLTKAAATLKDSATRVKREISDVSRGFYHDVHGVLVVWGPSAETAPAGSVAGVELVHGRNLKAWLDRLPDDAVDDEVLARVDSALREILRQGDAQRAQPSAFERRGFVGVAAELVTGMLASIVALLVHLMVFTASFTVGFVVALAGASTALALRRVPALAPVGIGWAAGAVASAALLGVVYGLSLMGLV